MLVRIGNNGYELRTTLGVAKKLEENFKRTLNSIMAELGKSATISEMVKMLRLSLKNDSEGAQFENDVLDNMDVITIQQTCDELLMNICFSGTPEEQEKKISDFPASALRKNLMRRALGLPIPKETDSTSEESSEQDTV